MGVLAAINDYRDIERNGRGAAVNGEGGERGGEGDTSHSDGAQLFPAF